MEFPTNGDDIGTIMRRLVHPSALIFTEEI
jgi:hypothetical protein